MRKYLENNATKETYKEHPKEIMLQEFERRRQFFKKIHENGANRIVLKYCKDKEKKDNAPYRKQKNYIYQLAIDGFIIHEENIKYSKVSIKGAQEKALNVFKRLCREVDRRFELKLNEKYINTKEMLDYLGIKYTEEK